MFLYCLYLLVLQKDNMASIKQLKDIASILRRDSIQMTSQAASGHPTSCLSCADIMSVLFFDEMSFDPKNTSSLENDDFVLSKGHAAPVLYSCLKRTGCIKEELLDYRKMSSPLQGHPVPGEIDWIKVASGSLGQGLSVGLGMALALKKQKKHSRVYVLLGDSEVAEGSVYEALELASYHKVNNLCAILDMNRLGQRGETMLGHNAPEHKKRFESFGWQAEIIDGHSVPAIMKAFSKARKSKKPFVIIAKTFKGKGVSFLENKEGWHGKALNTTEMYKALGEIPEVKFPRVKIRKPKKSLDKKRKIKEPLVTPYRWNLEVATREAYGNALAHLAISNPSIMAIDAEVSNSTFADKVKESRPNQFVEAFVAEQNMVSMALGLSIKGYKVFASSFAAFLSRAHDQIRMSSLSKADFTICGSHAGISIGEDGASQMGLEDISLFRDLPNSIVLYPSDAFSAEKLVHLCVKEKGLKYLRTTRPKTPLIYSVHEKFELGDFKVIKQSITDKVVLIGAGITLHESLKAHDMLKEQGIDSAVIDLYCIKPLNVHKLAAFIKHHGNKFIITEDHYEQGGIGEMLAESMFNAEIKMKHLFVSTTPHSGTKEELLEKYGLSAKHITMEARIFA